jgi:beta-lactamase regulating signal transducer with metallopeptidase domain
MASEILSALARSNLAAAVAILAVCAARPAMRRVAGAGVAYAAWLVVPIAALASLAPARSVVTVIARQPVAAAPLAQGSAPLVTTVPAMGAVTLRMDWQDAVLLVWLLGAALGVAWLLWRQHRFLAGIGPVERDGPILRARRSMAGPAVVGVFAPKILAPADFDQRFSAREQEVVLAHEGHHIASGDPAINALVLLWQCLNWFNPLAHVAARLLRLDQEFACDAAVMRRFPNARRSYAEAMLKAQTAAIALPLGCYWPAVAASALEQRLVLLKTPAPSGLRHVLGAGGAALLGLAMSVAVWASQSPRHVYVETPGSPEPAAAPEQHFLSMASPPRGATSALVTEVQATAPAPTVVADAPPSAPAAQPLPPAEDIPVLMPPWTPPAPTGVVAQPSLAADEVPATAVNSNASWSPPELQPGARIVISVSTQLPTGRMIGERISHRAGTNLSSGTWINDPHYILKANARQLDDDRVEFRPAFYLDGHLLGSGRVVVSGSGGAATIALDNGQVVTVTAALHPHDYAPPRPPDPPG